MSILKLANHASLLVTKGIATRSKDATRGAPGLTTRSKDAASKKGHRY